MLACFGKSSALYYFQLLFRVSVFDIFALDFCLGDAREFFRVVAGCCDSFRHLFTPFKQVGVHHVSFGTGQGIKELGDNAQ